MSVIINSGIIAVTSKSLDPYLVELGYLQQDEIGNTLLGSTKEEWAFRLLCGMGIEHLMFALLVCIQETIDDAPMWVYEENRRKAWKRDLAIRAEMSDQMQMEQMDNGKTVMEEYSHRFNHPQMEWHVDVRVLSL